VDASKLHGHCLSGPKLLLEHYQEKVRECLRFISASPDMSKAEKYVRMIYKKINTHTQTKMARALL
jgi:hypothetical protein